MSRYDPYYLSDEELSELGFRRGMEVFVTLPDFRGLAFLCEVQEVFRPARLKGRRVGKDRVYWYKVNLYKHVPNGYESAFVNREPLTLYNRNEFIVITNSTRFIMENDGV